MGKHTRRAGQREALLDYVAGEAREAPPVFAGRRGVIADIEATAATTLARWRDGRRFPGLTRVVQGAPGAGKSALLAHMEKKWSAARADGESGAPIGVNLPLEALMDGRRLPQALREGLPARPGQDWAPVVVGALASLLVPGTASEAASDGARALFETRQFRHPVVLMVDEAQDIRPSHREAGVVRMLHQGHVSGIPVLPVLAGLGHLREHLGQPGIGLSRFSNELGSVHTLGPLSEGEVRELFAGWLDRFGVSATDGGAARWADALVRDSQGWPMHTNHFLAALAEQLVMPGRDPERLDTAEFGVVRRRAARRRLAYYDTRYDNELVQERDHEVAEAMATIRRNGPADLRNTLDAIQDAFQYGDREDARRAFGVLRERGFLQSVPDPAPGGPRRYGCPIPSLASYAAARGFPPHHAATLGDADALNALVRRDRGALDIRDAMGRAPLHLAAECRWTDAAETLLAAGGDPDAPDAAGATARGTWPEFDWPRRAPEKKHDNGGGSGASGGPGGMG